LEIESFEFYFVKFFFKRLTSINITPGTDLVHDEVEYALLKEVETVKNCRKELEQFTDKCINQVHHMFSRIGITHIVLTLNSLLYIIFQLTNGRAIQHQLELNIQEKEIALGIDTVCHRMNNFSRGLQYYAGIEKYDRG